MSRSSTRPGEISSAGRDLVAQRSTYRSHRPYSSIALLTASHGTPMALAWMPTTHGSWSRRPKGAMCSLKRRSMVGRRDSTLHSAPVECPSAISHGPRGSKRELAPTERPSHEPLTAKPPRLKAPSQSPRRRPRDRRGRGRPGRAPLMEGDRLPAARPKRADHPGASRHTWRPKRGWWSPTPSPSGSGVGASQGMALRYVAGPFKAGVSSRRPPRGARRAAGASSRRAWESR
jgi:hypothetical protein